MPAKISIHWFRRDLRLKDNAALYHALESHRNVLPLFIFDTNILNDLEDKADARVSFIHASIMALHLELQKIGSTILVKHGKPGEIWKQLIKDLEIDAVYANHDYEPYAMERDAEIKNLLGTKNISFKTFKDHVIFEKNEILKNDGKPYTVYTPYSSKWKNKLDRFYLKSYPVERYFGNFGKIASFKALQGQGIPSLKQLGFARTSIQFPSSYGDKEIIKTYHATRNIPSLNGTTKLGVHLRFGTISIRTLARTAAKLNPSYLNELIWRDFYHAILFHFPHVVHRSFKPQYDKIKWRNHEKEFELWCAGKTGYPIVDAGMRELNTTGYMHNRVRMVVASFLTKHLLIDWRWGEAYFAKKLLDYDLAANNGGWQWAAGSGCDAAPYFRIFNPTEQMKKFDPDLNYVRKWIPEFDSGAYPQPIIEHSSARKRALEVYKKALDTK